MNKVIISLLFLFSVQALEVVEFDDSVENVSSVPNKMQLLEACVYESESAYEFEKSLVERMNSIKDECPDEHKLVSDMFGKKILFKGYLGNILKNIEKGDQAQSKELEGQGYSF